MKKLLIKGIIVLGILGVAAVSSNLQNLAGYPPVHAVHLQDTELAGGFTTLGYPPVH